MKIFMQNYVKIENFWYMRVIYIKRKLRTCTIQIQREKVWFFPKKKIFNIFNFFSKGGTLWCRNRQKIFFPFFKNFKNKTQKWLSWDHSNINRTQCARDVSRQEKKWKLSSLNTKFLTLSKEQLSQKSKFSLCEFLNNCTFKNFTLYNWASDFKQNY